jgi:hypothetical protein
MMRSKSRSDADDGGKGMWMGGLPPLGYRVRDRKLVCGTFGTGQTSRVD